MTSQRGRSADAPLQDAVAGYVDDMVQPNADYPRAQEAAARIRELNSGAHEDARRAYRMFTGYCWNAGSADRIGMPSALACATISRSKGSR